MIQLQADADIFYTKIPENKTAPVGAALLERRSKKIFYEENHYSVNMLFLFFMSV